MLSLCVCIYVRGLQVTILDLGTWFLVWWYLGTWVRKVFFSFSKFCIFLVLEQFSSFFLYNSHAVCLYVCSRPTVHNFWVRNLIFGMRVPWDMRKKVFFQFFEILIFSRFRANFRVFSSVCMSVRGLQVTIFDLETWFLVRGYLGTWVRKVSSVFRNFDFFAF